LLTTSKACSFCLAIIAYWECKIFHSSAHALLPT
jgi:hypothetical protein